MHNRLVEVLSCSFALVLLLHISSAQDSRNMKRFQSCSDVNLCCPGRNNTCYAIGPRMDGNFNESKCFCDDNCKAMKDCCIDHEIYCQSQRGECAHTLDVYYTCVDVLGRFQVDPGFA